MSINPKDLQKFYDMWAPVMSVLPSVITAVERENEVERHVQILQKDLERIKAEKQQVIEAAEAKLHAISEAIEETATKKAAADAEVKAYEADCKLKIADKQKATEAKINALESKVTAITQQIENSEKAHGMRLKAMEDELRTKQVEAEAQLAEIERKTAAANKALDNIRAKLGV